MTRILLPVTLLLSLTLAGCGNKGPLIKPSDVPSGATAAQPAIPGLPEAPPAAATTQAPAPAALPPAGSTSQTPAPTQVPPPPVDDGDGDG